MRLHEEKRRIVGQPHRNVTARKIVLSFGDQDLAGQDEFLLDFVMSHCEGGLVTSPRRGRRAASGGRMRGTRIVVKATSCSLSPLAGGGRGEGATGSDARRGPPTGNAQGGIPTSPRKRGEVTPPNPSAG